MVIISAVICNKEGQIILSRQFQNITKLQIEENINTFVKLIQSGQQHTFVENDNLRFMYLPIDKLYLVIITKTNSNILEDEETLKTLYQLVCELCGHGLTEENILDEAFEIILAFDDVISFGYRESVSVSQVINALEMESSEEKLFLLKQKEKLNEAEEAAKKHQKEVEQKRKMEARIQRANK